MIVLRIKNYNEIQEVVSKESLDELQIAIGRKFSMFVGGFGLVGQASEDRLFVFCPKIFLEEQFYAYAQKLILMMNSPNFLTVPQEQNLVYTMGMVVSKYENLSFSSLFEAAVKAKRKATRLSPIQVGHTKQKPDKTEHQVCFSSVVPIADDITFEKNVQESVVFRKCARLIATSTVPCSQLNNILELIGRYFEADRAYIIDLSKDGILKNTYEWCEEGIASEMANLQHIPIEKAPSFQHAYESQNMFLMYNISKSTTEDFERKVLEAQGIENMYISPLINHSEVFGFIGVDNPRKDDGASVLNAVSQIVAGELIKTSLIYKEKKLRQSDLVSGAKSRSSLTELLVNTNVEAVSSLGVFMANIIDLASVNTKYGISIGDRALHDAASTLKDAFGNDSVYRYGDSIAV